MERDRRCPLCRAPASSLSRLCADGSVAGEPLPLPSAAAAEAGAGGFEPDWEEEEEEGEGLDLDSIVCARCGDGGNEDQLLLCGAQTC